MTELATRGAETARAAQQRRLREVGDQLRAILGSGAVEVEEARVLLRGKGMIKRWLIDPRLRFLARGSR